MSYNINLYEITKQQYDLIKDLKPKELYNMYIDKIDDIDEPYLYLPDILGEHILPIANLDYDISKFSKVFSDSELSNIMEIDTDLYLLDKDSFRYIIDMYSKQIESYYGEMQVILNSSFARSYKVEYGSDYDSMNIKYDLDKLTQCDLNSLHLILNHIKLLSMDWTYFNRLALDDESTYKVNNSTLYEYSIFNLCNLYNKYDWDNKYIIFYGG